MTEANTASLKLPTFWTSKPQVWFQEAVAQFRTRGITSDKTKYAYTVVALDQDTASRLLYLLRAPTAVNMYATIKPASRELLDSLVGSELLQMGDVGETDLPRS